MITRMTNEISYETTKNCGTEWHTHTFQWGLENYVTMTADNGIQLILMKKEEYTQINSQSVVCGEGIRYTPIKSEDVPKYENNQPKELFDVSELI